MFFSLVLAGAAPKCLNIVLENATFFFFFFFFVNKYVSDVIVHDLIASFGSPQGNKT